MMTCPECPLSNRSICAQKRKCLVMCECNPFAAADRPWIDDISRKDLDPESFHLFILDDLVP